MFLITVKMSFSVWAIIAYCKQRTTDQAINPQIFEQLNVEYNSAQSILNEFQQLSDKLRETLYESPIMYELYRIEDLCLSPEALESLIHHIIMLGRQRYYYIVNNPHLFLEFFYKDIDDKIIPEQDTYLFMRALQEYLNNYHKGINCSINIIQHMKHLSI